MSDDAYGDDIQCEAFSVCRGTEGNDIIKGDLTANAIIGGGGDDTIYGLAGNDGIFGDFGEGEGGNDLIFGGEGNDKINGNAGNNNVSGGPGDDYIISDGLIYGNEGNDILIGSNGIHRIFGGPGDDKISDYTVPDPNFTESLGKDLVECGPGNDEVWINAVEDGDEASGDCEIIHTSGPGMKYNETN